MVRTGGRRDAPGRRAGAGDGAAPGGAMDPIPARDHGRVAVLSGTSRRSRGMAAPWCVPSVSIGPGRHGRRGDHPTGGGSAVSVSISRRGAESAEKIWQKFFFALWRLCGKILEPPAFCVRSMPNAKSEDLSLISRRGAEFAEKKSDSPLVSSASSAPLRENLKTSRYFTFSRGRTQTLRTPIYFPQRRKGGQKNY